MNNRLHNVTNPYQGTYKKVLTVCSAGLLRSPTLAWMLSQPPYEYNTRACGVTQEYALVPLDEALIHWADEIVFVHPDNHEEAVDKFPQLLKKNVFVLNLPDKYLYRDEELIKLARKQYDDTTSVCKLLRK